MINKVFIVDDDSLTCNLLKTIVEPIISDVEIFQHPCEFLTLTFNAQDIILLDLMMPEMDGIEACEAIRKVPELKHTIITFLTARDEDYSQVAGFEAGADDYITKPIKPKLLVSKVKALLRRLKTEETTGNLTIGNLVINREEYKIIKDGKELTLPRKEFELLSLLASKPGKVFKREDILDKVWGNEVVVGGRTIDVHIRKLREKIGDDCFKTVKGVGYKFVD